MIFLPHRGGLVRVTHEGDVQLFSIAEQEWMSGILIDEETINDVAVVHGEQYLLLACGSGIVRVVSILDSEGEVGMGPVADLALQPYSSRFCFGLDVSTELFCCVFEGILKNRGFLFIKTVY